MTPTYETLAARAERAVLGALLLRPDVYPEIAYLDAAQFNDPAHAALFDAIRSELAREASQTGRALAAHLQAAYAATGAAVDLDALIDVRPDPASVAAYARILVEADLHRTMNAHAIRIAVAAELGSPKQVQAEILSRREPVISEDAEQAPIPGSWKGSRPNREEHILADLIQHPDQIKQVSQAIDDATFTSSARGDLYDAISAVYERGEPVNALTVAWELDRIQADDQPGDGVDPAAYVDRLAVVPVEPGTALDAARKIASQEQLVADRQARARQATGPTFGAGAGPSAGRQVGRGQNVEVRRPTYGPPPTPGIDRKGPRIGH